MSRLTAAQSSIWEDIWNRISTLRPSRFHNCLESLASTILHIHYRIQKPSLFKSLTYEVKSRSTKFKRERVKRDNSIASEEGITDGITGKPLSKSKVAAPRRTSRRLSQVPKEEDSSPTQPDPPKRRRSSAQPVLSGPSRRMGQQPVTVIEESEPEDEEQLPVKKVGRTKKNAGIQSRRVSGLSGAEDSGWEDNNIFQSGAEDSSPARPTPVRPRASRSAGLPRKARKSTSAPPQMSVDSSPIRPPNFPDNLVRSPPQSPFRPSLPPMPTYKFSPSLVNSRITPMREFSPVVHTKTEETALQLKGYDREAVNDTQNVELESGKEFQDPLDPVEAEESESYSESQIDEALSRIISEEQLSIPEALPAASILHRPLNAVIRLSIWTMLAIILFSTYSYKAESSSIGFCNRGSNTSLVLDKLIATRAIKEECQKRASMMQNASESLQDTEKLIENCGLPPLFPLLHPSSCTPCPEHASCEHLTVTCDSGYLLKPHILLSFIPVSPSRSVLTTSHVRQLTELFFTSISTVVDGLPLFGSVGLPPRCLEDPHRKRHIGALGKAIESRLAQERGKRVCHGSNIDTVSPGDIAGEAIKWGIEESQLRDSYKTAISPAMLPQFDDLFNNAIQQLTQWGGVFVGETTDGKRYIAHKTPELSLQCLITVKSREIWAAWRATVIGSISILLLLFAARHLVAQKHKENRRITGLVQVALDTLRNQELAHYTDPLTTPAPYLSSIQLRDLVLQDEHSVPTRRRLWEKVERVVESNANVRANLEEIEGGDETRVWRWVGSSGRREREAAQPFKDEEE